MLKFFFSVEGRFHLQKQLIKVPLKRATWCKANASTPEASKTSRERTEEDGLDHSLYTLFFHARVAPEEITGMVLEARDKRQRDCLLF